MPVDAVNVASQLLVLLAFGCLVMSSLWVLATKRLVAAPSRLPMWEVGTLHFLILMWVILFVALVLAYPLARPFLLEGEGIEVRVVNMLVGALASQGPVLLVWAGLSWRGNGLLGNLCGEPRLSWLEALRAGTLWMLYALPWIGVANVLWRLLLYIVGPWGQQPQLPVEIMMEVQSLELMAVLLIVVGMLAPLSEEWVFRGLLFRYLKRRMSVRKAALVSGACFGLIHFDVGAFVPLTLLGYYLALAFEKSGDIRVPVVFHGLFNLIMSLFILLSV